jgi:hypothetical protein
MKSRLAQYLNEIVSITIMLLMAIALISGQIGVGNEADDAARGADLVVVISPGNE